MRKIAAMPQLLTICVSLPLLMSCAQDLSPVEQTRFIFGTPCSITLYGGKDASLFEEIFALLSEFDDWMSAQKNNSYVREINAASGIQAVSVPKAVYEVIRQGLAFSRLSGGKFDITSGPIVALWGIGSQEAKVPDEFELGQAVSLVGYEGVTLIEDTRGVMLEAAGMAIDLGGIAKGYAADSAVELLRSRGVKSGLLNFGGNVYALGSKPDGTDFRIALQHPRKGAGAFLGILEVSSLSVVTSGKYQRYLEQEGVRYHHILDTTTGYPVENGIESVTIVATSSLAADALSTTVFILGLQEGWKLVSSYDGVEAVIVSENKKVYVTEGLKQRFRLIDASYRLEDSPS